MERKGVGLRDDRAWDGVGMSDVTAVQLFAAINGRNESNQSLVKQFIWMLEGQRHAVYFVLVENRLD